MPMKYSVKVRPGIWSEVRFRKLEAIVGCRYKAAGRLLEFWQEAASYWVDGLPIPREIFGMMDCSFLIESGFAEEVDGGIRAKGDDDHFAWLRIQREKGVKSAEARRAKFGSAQPNRVRTQPEHSSNSGSATIRTDTNLELRTKNLELENTKKEVLRTFVETRVSPGDESAEKKIFASKSEIAGSETYVTTSIDLNAPNSDAVGSLQGDQCRDSQEVEKSTSGCVRPLKKRSTDDHGMTPKTPSPADLVAVWNENRGPLPKVLKVTGDRERKAKVRLREEPDLDHWKDAIIKLANWEWGTGHNSTGWLADFDYLLRPGTMVKALEGFFDAKTPKQKKTNDGISDEFIEHLARKYGHDEC